MSNNKPLAVVGDVTSIAPIDGADMIQKAFVDCGPAGQWIGVVGKDIGIGQKATVFLQDAVLPPNERWAFMERHKWRVRMARFKGVPSECVIVRGAPDLEPGTDLTEALGVTKYEKPVPVGMAGDVVGPFPSFIPKTDEPNFQTVPDMVERMGDEPWAARLKMDGTSCTVWRDDDGELHVASRNLELKEFSASGGSNVYWRCARQYDWSQLPDGCAMQFEVCGPGIQKNPAGLEQLTGFAFTLWDYRSHSARSNAELYAAACFIRMRTAPFLAAGAEPMSHDDLRDLADQKYPNGKPAEGVVIRALDGAWSFKVLNLNYTE